MIAASVAAQRPRDAKLLAVHKDGRIEHLERLEFARLLRRGDALIANDAATLPASLSGTHEPSGRYIEVRLTGRRTLAADDVNEFSAVVFGEGDFHLRTEDRPLPPVLKPGDALELGPLRARVKTLLDHPRLIVVHFDGTPAEVWEGLATHGRPIQYAHVPMPLELWDTWTPIAGLPVAFEPPSAGFVLDWSLLSKLDARGVRFGTLTHAAGISSTGDAQLDALLPFEEPYRIPEATARSIRQTRAGGGRVIAVGTTVVRALEHAASRDGMLRAGDGLADQRIGPLSELHVVNAVLSGTHERGTSHYELLGAFAEAKTLEQMDVELEGRGYRTHEFGDSVFVEAGRVTSG